MIALINWFSMSNCEAADTYLCILHDEVHHAWLEKHIEEMGFSSLYDAPPLQGVFPAHQLIFPLQPQQNIYCSLRCLGK